MKILGGGVGPPARSGRAPLLAEGAVHHDALLAGGCQPLQRSVHVSALAAHRKAATFVGGVSARCENTPELQHNMPCGLLIQYRM